jgi:hypothetical protein
VQEHATVVLALQLVHAPVQTLRGLIEHHLHSV